MTRLRAAAITQAGTLLPLLLAGCVSVGPTVPVAPAPGQSQASFQADHRACMSDTDRAVQPVANRSTAAAWRGDMQATSTPAQVQELYNLSYARCMAGRGAIVPVSSTMPAAAQSGQVGAGRPSSRPDGSPTTAVQASSVLHAANPSDPADLAILAAHGNTVANRRILNSCNDEVRPRIALPRPDVAVVVEEDATGRCTGSTLPSSLAVLVRGSAGWKVSTSTTGSGFTLGPLNAGYPDIVVQYPPSQRNCPVLRWDGRAYGMARSCGGSRGL